METAGMLSPEVVKALIAGGGMALKLFKQHSPELVAAAKGVLYVRINKNGRRYHIFGTHTQADFIAPSPVSAESV